MRLSCNLEVLCTVCNLKSNIFYSKKIPNSKAYDINLRSIIAFRENGKGYTGLESLCSLFDIVPPTNKNAYQKLLFCDKNSYKETAKLSMKTAADEVRNSVISEKNDTVNEDERATNKNAKLMLMIVILMRIALLLMMNLLLTLLFRVTVYGKRGDRIL